MPAELFLRALFAFSSHRRDVYEENSDLPDHDDSLRGMGVGGGKTDRDISDETYEQVLYADGFNDRIETAVRIGYNSKSAESSFVTEYIVCDDSGNEVCDIEVAHPEEKGMNFLQIIGAAGGTLGLALIGITAVRKRKSMNKRLMYAVGSRYVSRIFICIRCYP